MMVGSEIFGNRRPRQHLYLVVALLLNLLYFVEGRIIQLKEATANGTNHFHFDWCVPYTQHPEKHCILGLSIRKWKFIRKSTAAVAHLLVGPAFTPRLPHWLILSCRAVTGSPFLLFEILTTADQERNRQAPILEMH